MTNSPTTGWTDWSSTPKENQAQKLEARVAEIEKRFRTHLGIDFSASGADYPHPSQKVRALYFSDGTARLAAVGLQFIQGPFDYPPTISVVSDEFSDDPATDYPNFLLAPNVYVSNFPNDFLMGINDVGPLFTGIRGTSAGAIGPYNQIELVSGTSSFYFLDNGSGTTGWYVTGAPLNLFVDSSDPALEDGMIFYRSDTFRFRVRANGVTYNLATTADVPTTMNKQPFAAKTTTYTTTNADGVISVDATSASFTVTLVTASGNAGLTQTFKKINAANVVTIDANGSQTIDGLTTYALSAQWSWVTLVSDGANWLITGAG